MAGGAHRAVSVARREQLSPRAPRFFPHVHRLRGIAILGVVSMHVVSVLGDPLPGPARVLFDVVFGEGSPIFLMISGFLFREGLTKFAYKRFLHRKVLNVVIPYLVVSIPALVIYVGGFKTTHPWLPDSFFDANPIVQVVILLGTGAHLGPLWFVPMILLFFLVSPLWAYVDRHPRTYWVLPALLALTVLVPRPDGNSNPLQSFVHFASLFVLGMCLARYHDELIARCQRRPAVVVLLALAVVVGLAVAAQSVHALDSIMRGLVGALLIFVLYRWRNLGTAGVVLDRIGTASFPIFFLHGYPIAGLRALVDTDLSVGPWLAVWAGTTVVVVAVSAAVAFGAKRALGRRSRYIVGM